MTTSKKLEIIYHNGQPDGIRSIRRHLSTMTTYVI
ncbi:TPA: GIY-YIG nuclease family protein, partial [Candidatus Scatousia excrementigallinarum]|nr:GIY-YIG nuclease family protein [Candidatus Scatousia excrementigallinarum]